MARGKDVMRARSPLTSGKKDRSARNSASDSTDWLHRSKCGSPSNMLEVPPERDKYWVMRQTVDDRMTHMGCRTKP